MPAGQPASDGAALPAGGDATLPGASSGAARRAEHGRRLAAGHRLRAGSARPAAADPALAALLAADAEALVRCCDTFDRAARAGFALPPAGARLLDGFHVLDVQLRLARGGLRQAATGLPRLAAEGEPRAWALAREAVAQGDGRIDPDELADFLSAYQEAMVGHAEGHAEGQVLRVAELDALPALLRLALVDNLRRLAARAAQACAGREQAADWAARLADTAETRPGDLVLLVADMVRGAPAADSSFVAELARRLHGRSGPLAQVLDWIDVRLADEGTGIAQQMQAERAEEADDAVSVGNSLASLRLLGGVDWRAFAERLGAVDAILRGDPDGSYGHMDGATRDLYRHAVARLARDSRQSEPAVAREAVALAGVNRAPGEGGLDLRTRHVGHYLVGPGRKALVARLRGAAGPAAPAGGMERRRGDGHHAGHAVRSAATTGLTLLFVMALLVHAHQGDAGPLLLAAVGLLALPGASELARVLVRMMARWLAPPRPVPRMAFEAGIPASARTLVAVSAVARDSARVAALCDDLERHWLGNRDPALRFCLLLDLPDAAQQEAPGDAALLEGARSSIEELNARHGHERQLEMVDEDGAPQAQAERVEPFMLLVRPRAWSASEQAWIGRERRRGQLVDLNAWLCGAHERFSLVAGNTGAVATLRYVLALDAATGLPRDSARGLVAAMAHPLHLPLQDDGGRVLEGHGMLLPAIGAALPGRGATRHERLWQEGAGTWARAGHDPGAGWAAIYDVDTWRRALGDALEDDGRAMPGLFEEDRLRAARVPDLRLEALHPGSPGEQLLRRHRLLRAAWQETRGLLGGAGGLRTIDARRRLFDLLRASLVAPTLLAFVLLCWNTLAAPVFWSAAALAVFFLPALLGMLVALGDRPFDAPWRQHLDAWARGARVALLRAVLGAAFLPHAAWADADALARALVRRHGSRRRLLETRPRHLARPGRAMENNWRTMWFAPLLAVGAAVLLTFANPYALFATAPLLLVWFLSPVLAWWASQPLRRGRGRLAPAQALFLRALARRTWAFFETHTSARGLAPEAVFEHPEPGRDARISPAGMGGQLLATLSARDFGFVPLGGLLERTEAALASMALLERWNGHFLAWYDGVHLKSAEPARVDTAASGNLVLALRTFAAGLDELPDRPVAGSAMLEGIRAGLLVLREQMGRTPAPPAAHAALDALEAALLPERCRATDTLPGLADCLRAVTQEAARLAAHLPLAPADDLDPALGAWAARIDRQCQAQLDDLVALAPWMRAVQEYVLDAGLTRIPTLRELAAVDLPAHDEGLARLVETGRACARDRLARIEALARQARALAQVDFGALADAASGHLAAGFDLRARALDSEGCDLLASEARMASFAAVAQDQLPQRHWWSLGRPLRMAGGGALLLSRCGALADYLAPQLVMPAWRDTLLDNAAVALVRLQALHAKGRAQAWGYSESACNAVDAAARYRFARFGLPAAALARRADDDLVAAPHAAALGLLVAPALATANLQRMAQQGLLGETGFYEGIDHAPGRLPQGERQALVRAQAARHQAMILLALAQHLEGAPMQRRFCRDAEFRAALGLLQEPPPASGATDPARPDSGRTAQDIVAARPYARTIVREAPSPASPASLPAHLPAHLPEVQLLSNGRYHLVLDSDGAGASRWEDAAITRPGPSEAGMACYVRDTGGGQVWSTTLLPALAQDGRTETVFVEGRASFRRLEHGIATTTDVAVAPDDDVELRRIRILNRGDTPRTLELTSCVALAAPPLAAGGRSGVKVEFDAAADSLLCLATPAAPVVVHRMTLRGAGGHPEVESSRARFIGRGHDLRLPHAVGAGGALAGLDPEPDAPLLALRRTVILAPHEEVTVDLVLGVASSRAVARELAARYGAAQAVDRALDRTVDRAIEAAWSQGQAFLRRLDLGEADAQLYTRLAGCLLRPVAALRADPAVIERNVLGRADLARYGIGALPILLLQLADDPGTDAGGGLARQLLQAHAYWRSRGFAADLLVLCENRAAREGLMHLAMSVLDPDSFDRPGGVHLHLLADLPQEDRILLRASAHVLLASERGDLGDQLRRAGRAQAALPAPFAAAPHAPAWSSITQALEAPELRFDNGIGGFTPDGREYVVRSGPGLPAPPTPWVNLLANGEFGSVVSERGHATTWYGTRGTHLSAGAVDDGDAVAPRSGEAFYLRDEDSGAAWSPTPWPAPSEQDYLARHGFGYSVFEHRAHGVHSTLRCFVAVDAPLKYAVLRLRNDSDATRRLSATGYVEWLLDDTAAADAGAGLQVVTGIDLASGALFARNAFGAGLRDKVAFFHVEAEAETVASTCDRAEFLGPHGAMAQPACLVRAGLSGVAGAGVDPCAALQVPVMLAPGEERELVFVLGVSGPGTLDASRTVQRHGGAAAAARAWKRLRAWWDDTLGAIRVQTPDPAFDLRVNGWLPYQAIGAMMGEPDPAARLQSALVAAHLRPQLLRAALLRAARDFALAQARENAQAPAIEDFLWLPFALTRYVAATGDQSILAALPFGEGEDGAAAGMAARDDLYQHCVHGLRGCLRFGPRGLPLAAGRVHEEVGGRAESVRLGFLMTVVLQRFADVADRRGDFGFATTCRGAALALKAQCEEHGWDGEWYRWAWLDSATALGGLANPACRAELSTQGWAVLAGAAQGAAALHAASRRLATSEGGAGGMVVRCDPPVDGEWSAGLPAWPGQDHRALAWAAAGFARLGDAGPAWALAGLLDPLARTATPQACAGYGAAPYFIGDGVRAVAPHAGRAIGGADSTAAAWTWLLLVESLLGVERDGQQLRLAPRLAPGWDGMHLRYRHGGSFYEIAVGAGDGAPGMQLDGQPHPDGTVLLRDERRDHRVVLRVPPTPAAGPESGPDPGAPPAPG